MARTVRPVVVCVSERVCAEGLVRASVRPCVHDCLVRACACVRTRTKQPRLVLGRRCAPPFGIQAITGVISPVMIRFLPAAQERTGCLPDYTRHCAQSPVPPLDGTSREARIYGHGKVLRPSPHQRALARACRLADRWSCARCAGADARVRVRLSAFWGGCGRRRRCGLAWSAADKYAGERAEKEGTADKPRRLAWR